MVERDPLDEALTAVEDSGLLRNPHRMDQLAGRGGAALVGKVDIEGIEVSLRIVLGASFPLRLPMIFLEPWDALGFIPHVSPRGLVCFLDPEGLVLDRYRPSQIAIDSLEKANMV